MGLPRAVIVGLLCAMTLLPNGCGVGPPPLSIALTSREVTERALVVKCGDVVTGVLEIDDATRMRWATMDLGVTSARGIVSLRGVEGLVPVHISVRVDVQQLLSMQGKECYAAVRGSRDLGVREVLTLGGWAAIGEISELTMIQRVWNNAARLSLEEHGDTNGGHARGVVAPNSGVVTGARVAALKELIGVVRMLDGATVDESAPGDELNRVRRMIMERIEVVAGLTQGIMRICAYNERASHGVGGAWGDIERLLTLYLAPEGVAPCIRQ